MWEWQLLLAGLQVLLPRYGHRRDVGGSGSARGGFGATHVWNLPTSPSTCVPPSRLPMGTSPSPVNCGRPEADFNSVVYGNDWWVGSVVRYSCRPGFLLLGDPASACQSDGRWTPKPTCLRE